MLGHGFTVIPITSGGFVVVVFSLSTLGGVHVTAGIAEEPCRPKRVVLCVDDDRQMLDVLDAFLTQSGYHVLTASTAESTLIHFLNNRVDAVVTDYEIGAVTSEDVIVSLRSLRPGIPVLLFSGAEDIPPSVLALASASIHKTEIKVLVSELARVLADNAQRSD